MLTYWPCPRSMMTHSTGLLHMMTHWPLLLSMVTYWPWLPGMNTYWAWLPEHGDVLTLTARHEYVLRLTAWAWWRIDLDCLSMVAYWPWLPASVRPQAPCILLVEAMNHWSINGKPSISIECLPNCWKNHLNNLNHQFSNYCELTNSIEKYQLINAQ